MDVIVSAEQAFATRFGGAPAVIGEAPGRVNLIGEHTDYNGGKVLPTALPLRLTVALAPRDDDALHIGSEQQAGVSRREMSDAPLGHWSDHLVGALVAARRAGFIDRGVNLSVTSQIPQGGGLSSSAALIVATLRAARALGGGDESTASDLQLAQLARQVENDYLGVPCGIMDQMAVALGAVGEAMLLDTTTLDYQRLSIPAEVAVCIVHSGVARRLSDGRYGERKRECDAAQVEFGGRELCALDPTEVENARGVSDVSRRRARHCASEHRRVIAAGQALARTDLGAFGELMRHSHRSMRDDFEMSLPVIDALVDDANALGAIGARLTGGGFGGCVVALVERAHQHHWYTQLLDRHPQAYAVL
ncbi:MAG: galactokinase [Pseudomonadota bacterium]